MAPFLLVPAMAFGEVAARDRLSSALLSPSPTKLRRGKKRREEKRREEKRTSTDRFRPSSRRRTPHRSDRHTGSLTDRFD